MRLSVVLASCAVLAAMSSMAKAATLAQGTEPGGAPAALIGNIFPGATLVTGTIGGSGIFAGTPVQITSSHLLGANPTSVLIILAQMQSLKSLLASRG